jgi:hypothetical protein
MGLAAVTLAPAPVFAQEEPAEAAPQAPASEESAKLEQANKALEQLNYPEAQQLLLEVVQSGKATSEELAQAYFNIGVIEAGLDHDVEATDAFYIALMLKPDLLFPAGGSPKIRQRLNEARSRVTEVGVLEARTSVKGGVLDVEVRNDPLKLVKRVEVVMTRADGDVGKATLEKGSMRAEVESDVKSIKVIFYDESGNQLKTIDVDPAKAGAGPVNGGGENPSVWQSWGLWAGVAGALAVGGTYFIMESSSLQGDIDDEQNKPAPDVTRVSRLEDSRDRVGLYGIVGLSAAGAAAVTAGALLLFSDHGDDKPKEKDSSEASLVPSFAPGHVGARFSMRF